MTTTAAARYRALLFSNIDRWDRDEQTYEDFQRRNRQIWNEIRAAGLDEAVLGLIRPDPSNVTPILADPRD